MLLITQLRASKTLVTACLRLLRPLARIMLRHGLSTYDFARIANIAFVRQPEISYGNRAKPLSFSRVSAITGLHRHVVSDIVNSPMRRQQISTADKDYQRNRLARVLTGWFESPQYTDSDGRPQRAARRRTGAVIRVAGSLLQRRHLSEDHSRRIAASRCRQDPEGRHRPRRRPSLLRGRCGTHLSSISAVRRATSSIRSSTTSRSRRNRACIDDSVVSVRLNRAALPLLRRMLRRRGDAFLEDVEGWVSEHETTRRAATRFAPESSSRCSWIRNPRRARKPPVHATTDQRLRPISFRNSSSSRILMPSCGRFLQLGTRIVTDDHIVGVLRDAASDLCRRVRESRRPPRRATSSTACRSAQSSCR